MHQTFHNISTRGVSMRTFEPFGTNRVKTRTIISKIDVDRIHLQGYQSDNSLKRRAWRIQTLNSTIVQRFILIGQQF
jgi:hypothetical protein